jgi:hypothetical protein
LAGLLKQLEFCTPCKKKNSFQFVQIVASPQLKPDDLMVSFDVASLFTKVPVADSLELLSHHFEDEVLALFKQY